jgi:hypothetical protein
MRALYEASPSTRRFRLTVVMQLAVRDIHTGGHQPEIQGRVPTTPHQAAQVTQPV